MGSAIGSIAGGITSLFGGKARRAEEKTAQGEFDTNKAAYDGFQFQNQFGNLENTAEDLTVNTQAAQFQGQQADANLAQGLQGLIGGGGGGTSAQAIAQASLQAGQGVSNTIATQEQSNNQLRAQQAAQNQTAEAQGAQNQETNRFGKVENQYSLSSDRLAAAKQARAQATKDLVGGVVGAASLVGGGLTGGGTFGENLATNFGGAAEGTGGGQFDPATGQGSYGSYKNQGGTQSRSQFKSLYR